MKFLTIVTGVKNWFRQTFKQTGSPRTKTQRTKTHRARKVKKNPTWSEIRQYKYLICPQCTQRLRVPRGKGRIRVTCTRCGNVFETKS
jgi:RNase P subunit RPR2